MLPFKHISTPCQPADRTNNNISDCHDAQGTYHPPTHPPQCHTRIARNSTPTLPLLSLSSLSCCCRSSPLPQAKLSSTAPASFFSSSVVHCARLIFFFMPLLPHRTRP